MENNSNEKGEHVVAISILKILEEDICVSKKLGLFIENTHKGDENYNYIKKKLREDYEKIKKERKKWLKSNLNISNIMKSEYYKDYFQNIKTESDDNLCRHELIKYINLIEAYNIEGCIFENETYEKPMSNQLNEYSIEFRFMKLFEFIRVTKGIDHFAYSANPILYFEKNLQCNRLFESFEMNTKNNIIPNCIEDNERKLKELIKFGHLIDDYIEDDLDYYKLEYIMDMIINVNTEIQMLITCVLIIEMLILNPNKPIREEFIKKVKSYIKDDIIKDISEKEKYCALVYNIRSRLVHGNYNSLKKNLNKYKNKYLNSFDINYAEFKEETWILQHIAFTLYDITKELIRELLSDKKKLNTIKFGE